MPNPTESVDVGQDEHTYGPEQVDEFGRALIQPGVPCTVSRDEDGELVYEFDCKAPRRPDANVKIDPSVRSVRPVFGPVIHASRPTRSGRVVVKRRSRSTRTTTPSRGDPDDDPDERSEQTWALTFVDRAPVLWRFRAARCRFEVRPVDGGEVVEHAQVPAAPERGEHDVPADQPGSARDQRLSYAAANTAGEEQSPSHGRLGAAAGQPSGWHTEWDVAPVDLEMIVSTAAAFAGAAMPEWRCPTHGTELQDTGEALVCRHGESFQLRNGIPRFADEVYAKPFGLQWNRYRLTQLDSYTHTTHSRDRARRCVGDELWQRLAGMQVLECGCGAGRFTEVLLDRGAVVTSVDVTGAVDANQKTFPQGPAHRIAQADILGLPFEPRRFDVVFCLGVIQHTPSPELTIARLYEHVRPGGWLVFDHYAYRLGWYLSLKPLYRRALRRLPAEKGLRYTERLVDLFLPLHGRSRLLQMLVGRISPVYSYYGRTRGLSDEVHRSLALLDTYDGLMDWYKWFRTQAQIRRILEQLRLERIWIASGGNGIEARGRRPPRELE